MKDNKIRGIILNFVHTETGWGNPLRPHCEIENLYLRETTELPEGNLKVEFQYNFDEDGWSQYDKTHVLMGMVIIDAGGKLCESTLKETHTGIAAICKPYNSNNNNQE